MALKLFQYINKTKHEKIILLKINGLKYLLSVSFLLIFYSIFGQYEFDWARTYGGDGWDEALSAVETVNGDVWICGYTKSKEKYIWLMKISAEGKPKWGRTYKTMPVSEAKDIVISSDSCIVMAGYCVKPFEYTSNLWLIKLDKNGNKLWYKDYGSEYDEKANSMVETYDKGYAIAGMTKNTDDFEEDAWIIKVDSSGNKLWEAQFGYDKTDYASDIIETYDHNLISCGMMSSQGREHKSIWLVKLDSLGNEIWNNTYELNKWNVGTSLVQGLDSNIYVAAYTRMNSLFEYDIALLKINTDGELIWKKVFSWGRRDQSTSITRSYDGGIIISGFSRQGKELSSDFAISKFDSNGTLVWDTVFQRKSLDYSNKVLETMDNGIMIAGASYMQGRGWDFAVLKYKRTNQPTINFKQDSISTSINETYNLEVCITSEINFKNIQLFFNDSLYKDNIKQQELAIKKDSNCNIPLNFDLTLLEGENKIEVVATDSKNRKINNSCIIYFVPPSEESW